MMRFQVGESKIVMVVVVKLREVTVREAGRDSKEVVMEVAVA